MGISADDEIVCYTNHKTAGTETSFKQYFQPDFSRADFLLLRDSQKASE